LVTLIYANSEFPSLTHISPFLPLQVADLLRRVSELYAERGRLAVRLEQEMRRAAGGGRTPSGASSSRGNQTEEDEVPTLRGQLEAALAAASDAEARADGQVYISSHHQFFFV